MLRISQKLLVLVMGATFAPLSVKPALANPIDLKNKAPVSSSSKPISATSKPAESSNAKSVSSSSKPSASKSNPEASDPADLLKELNDDGSDRKRSGRHGKREHKNRDERGGRRRKEDIPSFRKVRTLESLTPVQEAKITHIIKEQREKSLPFSEKLKEIREASSGSEDGDTGRRRKTPESAGLRRKVHAIKKDAWLQIQKILTPRQKIELEALNESGPPRRKHPDAQPAAHDSGKSFSK